MNQKLEITLDVILHATEDITKFYKEFEEQFEIKDEQFSIQELTGHYDNPITRVNAKIADKKAINVVKKIISKISIEEKDEVIRTLNERIDDSNLYLRIDKQEFVKGRIIIGEKNSIKIKIYTPIYTKKDILEVYENLLNFK